MVRRFRGFAAALAVAALIVSSATPAFAGKLEDIDDNSVPAFFDLLVLRPIGLATVIAGGLVFVPAAALTFAFRPTHPEEMQKPYNFFVKEPVEFTFKDPIGSH